MGLLSPLLILPPCGILSPVPLQTRPTEPREMNYDLPQVSQGTT